MMFFHSFVDWFCSTTTSYRKDLGIDWIDRQTDPSLFRTEKAYRPHRRQSTKTEPQKSTYYLINTGILFLQSKTYISSLFELSQSSFFRDLFFFLSELLYLNRIDVSILSYIFLISSFIESLTLWTGLLTDDLNKCNINGVTCNIQSVLIVVGDDDVIVATDSFIHSSSAISFMQQTCKRERNLRIFGAINAHFPMMRWMM